MANLEEIITSKNASDIQWKTQQQADRNSVTEMQDRGMEMIVSDPDQYIRYLTMQGDNPTYSAGNVAIVLAGMKDATIFGTRDRWQTLGRTVMLEEQDRGVKIFARDARTKAYALTDAYDVTQTQGKDVKHKTLRENTPEMSSALQRHRLESYWTTNEAFDSWLDGSLSYYATEVLQDREREDLPYAERIKRRNELEQQRLEARKKAVLADSDKSEE